MNFSSKTSQNIGKKGTAFLLILIFFSIPTSEADGTTGYYRGVGDVGFFKQEGIGAYQTFGQSGIDITGNRVHTDMTEAQRRTKSLMVGDKKTLPAVLEYKLKQNAKVVKNVSKFELHLEAMQRLMGEGDLQFSNKLKTAILNFENIGIDLNNSDDARIFKKYNDFLKDPRNKRKTFEVFQQIIQERFVGVDVIEYSSQKIKGLNNNLVAKGESVFLKFDKVDVIVHSIFSEKNKSFIKYDSLPNEAKIRVGEKVLSIKNPNGLFYADIIDLRNSYERYIAELSRNDADFARKIAGKSSIVNTLFVNQIENVTAEDIRQFASRTYNSNMTSASVNTGNNSIATTMVQGGAPFSCASRGSTVRNTGKFRKGGVSMPQNYQKALDDISSRMTKLRASNIKDQRQITNIIERIYTNNVYAMDALKSTLRGTSKSVKVGDVGIILAKTTTWFKELQSMASTGQKADIAKNIRIIVEKYKKLEKSYPNEVGKLKGVIDDFLRLL